MEHFAGRVSRSLLAVCAVLGMAALSLPIAHAQSNTGTILGTVQDSTGAVIPDATVLVKDLGTGQMRTVKSGASGTYTVPDLQVGHYSITVTHPGFKAESIADTELQVAQQATVNVVMSVGAATDVVTVTAAETPLLTQSSSSVGQVVDTQTVQNMPINGRDFWQLTQLTPGVNYIQGGQNIPTGGTEIRASAVNVDVNGLSPSWTGWYLDGGNVTEFQLGGTIIQPNVDALQEFKVESGNMGADYGHSPTIVNATLKSGTNQFHGTAYEFVRNNSFDAKGYFFVPTPGTTQRDEAYHRNQFGYVVGGPIWKNKTFFFLDMQETIVRQGEDFNNIVPTAQELTGNFTGDSTVIKNPLTHTQVSSNGVANVIPSTLLSQQSAFFLKYMPPANYVVGSTSEAIVTNGLKQQLGEGDMRIDQELTQNDRLMGRYSIGNNIEADPNPYPAMGDFPLRSRGQDVLIRETHIFSPKWINEAQASYYRSFFFFTSSLMGQDIADEAGLIGLDGIAPAAYVGAPTLTITSYSTFDGQAGNSYPKSNKIRSYQYLDRLSYVSGKHNLRLGYELFHDADSYISGSTSTGSYTFGDKYSGDNFADFLMGYPSAASRAYFRELWGSSGNFHAIYAQDDYQFGHGLTLNLGVRWEINPFYTPLLGQTTGYDTSTGDLVLPSNYNKNAQPGTPLLTSLFSDRFEYTNALHLPENIRRTDTHDVAPRLGFAYSPGALKGTVIRGAYGMFYLYVDDNGLNNTQDSVPFIASQSVTNTATTPTYNFTNYYQGQQIASANPNPGQPCSWGVVYLSCSQPSLSTGTLSMHDTYIQEWNLAVQHQFGQRVSLDVAYVGNNTTHMLQSININDPAPGAGTVQNRRPWEQWGPIGVYTYGPTGHGNYNALQSKFEMRNFGGATALVSYTYGKCLINATYSTAIEQTSLIDYYGPCTYNLTQNLVTSFVYELPFGKGKHFLSSPGKLANGIVGNWALTGILTSQSGLPFTPTISVDEANTGVSSQRPNKVGPVQMVKSPKCWFYDSANSSCTLLNSSGTNAYALPTQYTYGDGGIDTVKADNLLQFDTSLMKDVHFTETRSLEFRVSFYNIFNRPTFSSIGTNIDTSSAGLAGAQLNTPRLGEVAAKLYF